MRWQSWRYWRRFNRNRRRTGLCDFWTPAPESVRSRTYCSLPLHHRSAHDNLDLADDAPLS